MERSDDGPPEAKAIGARLAAIRTRIGEIESAAGRTSGAVTLVAVSKVQPDERIDAALAAGQRVFGENRVQEAQARWASRRPGAPDLALHLIGPLQTNKARDAVALFDVIESIDRPKLATAVAEAMARAGRSPLCLIQVNTGEEPQKAGVLPRDLDGLVHHAVETCGLPVRGLMCIPPVDEPPSLHFALLADMARRHALPWLSMGMSGDFETAIRYGATHVRLGTAVFGERVSPA